MLLIVKPKPKRRDTSANVELVEYLCLQDSVEFTGKKQADEVTCILKNARIRTLDRSNSLQAKNGLPTKLGEYLFSKNPVVVTNI